MWEVKELPHNFIWGLGGWNPHPSWDPSSRPPARNVTFHWSVANRAVRSLHPLQQMVSRIRGPLFQVHWVSKWRWGPRLFIWLFMCTAFQPRRPRQRRGTLIHSMWYFRIRKIKVCPCYHLLFIFKYRCSELSLALEALPLHIPENLIRVPSHLVNASKNVWGM